MYYYFLRQRKHSQGIVRNIKDWISWGSLGHHSRARRAALRSATVTSTHAVFVRKRWVGLSATLVARYIYPPTPLDRRVRVPSAFLIPRTRTHNLIISYSHVLYLIAGGFWGADFYHHRQPSLNSALSSVCICLLFLLIILMGCIPYARLHTQCLSASIWSYR